MENNIFAITANANYINQALEEAREVDKQLKVLQNYNNGILLVSTTMTKEQFNSLLIEKKPVFIRHANSFDMTFAIHSYSNPAEVALQVNYLKESIAPGSKVAIQIRKGKGEYAFNPIDLKNQMDLVMEQFGAVPEVKNPEYIISVLLDEEVCYIGCSTSNMNLSTWSGGMVHYKKEDADISRAKFKLMEAISAFDIDMTSVRSALDLGAAPGGWTSVLLEHKVAVTAVDTGEMDPRLNKYKNYTYIKANAADIDLGEARFDMITSDISWNAKNTAAMINKDSKYLKDGGYAVVTLKLMGDKVRRTIKEVKAIYQEVFDILAVKQLFHNREEVTVLLKKR